MIKPTVGRMLHYYPAVDDNGVILSCERPLAATIAHVWNDRCINIAYLDVNGVSWGKLSVPLVQEGDEARPGSGYCAWMPYQKGQAAKTEAVQREAVDALLNVRVPILDQITELCWAIEKCGASPELTDAVTKASALREPISEMVRQAILLGVGAEFVGAESSGPASDVLQIETRRYTDGTVATGVAPLPELSPAECDALVTSRDVPCDVIEKEIQAKGLTAPRITPADIEAAIVSEHYFTAHQGDAKAVEVGAFSSGLLDAAASRPTPDALRLLTFCVLVLRNGFTVTGESACASPENFDAEIGQKIARQSALQKVWPLEGYLLRERLHNAPAVAGAVALLGACADCCETNAAERAFGEQSDQDRANAVSYRLAASLLQVSTGTKEGQV